MYQGFARITRKVFRRERRVRDSASFGAASLGVLLLVGAALGTGVARTAVDVSDGLTWLPDNQRGEVVQVNPASGRPEVRLQVSGGDALLDITQKDGLLVILDRRSGQITTLDLATLLASGRRQVPSGPAAKVLVSEGRIYVVDRPAGTIVNADPVTLADIGKPWRAGTALADAVADDDGVLWAVDRDGRLHSLEWAGEQFRVKATEQVRGAGAATVLVPHPKGVTLFGLDGGVVRQVGTGTDVNGSTPRLSGEVLAAKSSPVGLVPASVPDQGIVVIVSGDQVVRVATAALGCATPTRPVVFRDKVYVPCRGAAKVIVLDRAGKRGGTDVPTPGAGDPEIVYDDGRLFISTPDAERGVVVDPDGSTHSVRIRDPELPVVNPDRPPIPEVPTPPRPSPRPDPPTGRDGDEARPPDNPGPGQPTSSSSAPGVTGQLPDAPTGVTVALADRSAAELTLAVSWTAAEDNGEKVTGYTVTATGDFSGSTRSAQTTDTSTQLTIPCGGSTFCDGGQLTVSVTALNPVGESAPGTRSWSVPGSGTTTENPPPPPPPPTTTTTEPPPPPPTTTTTEPPAPPPATVPTAGATVISNFTAPNGNSDYTRQVNMSPPADWASHDGTCQVINTTHGYNTTISCGATTASIGVESGANRIVVRAIARDGSRSVDSASKSVNGPRENDMCGKVKCVGGGDIIELTPTGKEIDLGQAGAGLGLLVIAVALRFAGRRKETTVSEKDGER